MIPFRGKKNLGFVFQPAKRFAVNNPIPIPLERRPEFTFLLQSFSSPCVRRKSRPGSQHLPFKFLCSFSYIHCPAHLSEKRRDNFSVFCKHGKEALHYASQTEICLLFSIFKCPKICITYIYAIWTLFPLSNQKKRKFLFFLQIFRRKPLDFCSFFYCRRPILKKIHPMENFTKAHNTLLPLLPLRNFHK